MTNTKIITTIRKEIERRINVKADSIPTHGDMSIDDYATLGGMASLQDFLSFLSTLESGSSEIPNNLEEAAWDCVLDSVDVNNPVLLPKYKELLTYLFIAGAKWQKEQDQPITGNSLEQEWLRYVDRKKKEYGGELPSLGEYGWLQIARHFSEWQKNQMLNEAMEGTYDSYPAAVYLDIPIPQLKHGDKVRVIIIPNTDEK